MKERNIYIGLMSGTSIDGVDVAAVEFTDQRAKLLASSLYPIPNEMKVRLAEISTPKVIGVKVDQNRIETMAELDVLMGEIFANAVNFLISDKAINKESIIAIGSHGQTIRHRAECNNAFTLQIGDPNVIAENTGIKTIADFRRSDIAAGGQGAPLAPAFHNAILRSKNEDRIILNLGGIANITLLPKLQDEIVLGFDTGPANTLMDAWYKKHNPDSSSDFDKDSQFGKAGTIIDPLLSNLLTDPYFTLPPPKSTGREYFSIHWLERQLTIVDKNCTPQDVQRTLVEFTATTIADAINTSKLTQAKVLSCGGGMHNRFLLDAISRRIAGEVIQTNDVGVDGDYLEAMTFAWLAKRRIEQKSGNLPSVTGAVRTKILGGVYLP
ncbi:MAG: anhydro-N-acetylmuramic acid kinase [Kangiellaceae bacterium]|nr:anhydro-N-acetylmuramic acid kinase [Kangiellaceae bacterium]